ncbi:hypothetical protein GCM10009593_09630 [Microlunatus antarcticus]
MLRDTLAAHRSMLMGALNSNEHLDIDRAFAAHAGLARVLTHWDDLTAHQQRAVMETVEYVVNGDDEQPDLTSPDGFADDLARVRALQAALGYA